MKPQDTKHKSTNPPIKKQLSLMENENGEGISAKEIEKKDKQENNNHKRKRIQMQEIPETLKPWVEQAKDEGASAVSFADFIHATLT